MITYPETYRCQVCHNVSTNREKIKACEAQDIDAFERRLSFYANQYKLNDLDNECVKLINWSLEVYKKAKPITIVAVERDYDSHGYFYHIKESRAVYNDKSFSIPYLAQPFFTQTTMQYVADHQEQYRQEYQKGC